MPGERAARGLGRAVVEAGTEEWGREAHLGGQMSAQPWRCYGVGGVPGSRTETALSPVCQGKGSEDVRTGRTGRDCREGAGLQGRGGASAKGRGFSAGAGHGPEQQHLSNLVHDRDLRPRSSRTH